MTRTCPNHNLNYSYTCPACEYEYYYASRTNLLTYFRAGVKGKSMTIKDVHAKAAYEEGLKFCDSKETLS